MTSINVRLNEKRGTCPVCGYHNAFVETTGKNGHRIGWCASCQDREAIATYLRAEGNDTRRAAGDDAACAENALKARQKAQERARVIWSGAASITADDPAGKYLARRGLACLIGYPFLRYRADVPHPSGGRHPALIAPVLSASAEFLGVHRTYLSPDGSKARLEPTKASLGSIWGGCILVRPCLEEPDWEETVIGEGLETTASAAIIFDRPAIAAVSAGNMATGLILSSKIRSVIIAADHDRPGLEAAETAARRWTSEGRTVRIITPEQRGTDFNDLLQANKKAAH